MRKNHKTTTTLLVAMAAIAATLLAAGTVAALGSNHFAFAHKDYKKWYGEDNKYGGGDKYGNDNKYGGGDKYGNDNKYGGEQGRDNYGKDQKRDGDQYHECIVIGSGDEIKRSDGGTEKADPAQPPGLTSDGGRGISDNSCNNYDSGVLKVPIPGSDGVARG
jgi:hypothetical protein